MSKRMKYYDLYSQQFKANPYDTYANMRTEDPMMELPGYQSPLWFVTGYEEAKLILSDHTRFVKDYRNTLTEEERENLAPVPELYQLLNHHMLGVDKPDHTRLRAIVSKAFTVKRVEALEPRIQQIADELIDAFPAQGSADLIDAYAFPLPIVVICELLGVPAEDRDKFRLWSNTFVEGAASEGTYVGHMLDFFQYIVEMVAKRRQQPQDDLITALVRAEADGDHLSEQELYSMVSLLIVAGHETTVNLIANGMLALLQHPEQKQRLQQNPDLTEAAIEEFLRYDGPVDHSTPRYAAEDVEINGHLIKRGTPVIISLSAVNRDPGPFDDPDVLDIHRQNNKHLNFGYGVHYCLGAPLARLEGKIAINTLLWRVPDLELARPVSDLRYRDSTVVRGVVNLPVIWGGPIKPKHSR